MARVPLVSTSVRADMFMAMLDGMKEESVSSCSTSPWRHVPRPAGTPAAEPRRACRIRRRGRSRHAVTPKARSMNNARRKSSGYYAPRVPASRPLFDLFRSRGMARLRCSAAAVRPGA